jgi:aminopeptidase N
MDEGFTSFAQNITQYELFNDIYDLDPINPLLNSYKRYFEFLEDEIEEPLTTHSDHFSTNRAYGVGSYTKGAIFLSQLGYIIGDKTLFKGLRRYYNEWKFKHPDKNDFIRIIEKESDLELDWYLDYWIGTTDKIDYSIELINSSKDIITLELKKIENMPMPIELEVLYSDNSKKNIYIPLSIMRGEKKFKSEEDVIIMPDWEWVNDSYSLELDIKDKLIKSITIDPKKKLADYNRTNNFLKIN